MKSIASTLVKSTGYKFGCSHPHDLEVHDSLLFILLCAARVNNKPARREQASPRPACIRNECK